MAVDIQEYSRVLASALLNPAELSAEFLDQLDMEQFSLSSEEGLIWAALPLIDYEHECILSAVRGDPEPLCGLIENGSMQWQSVSRSPVGEIQLRERQRDVSDRLNRIGLLKSSRSLVLRHYGGVYFSYYQAVCIDLMLDLIAQQPADQRDTLLAAALAATSDAVNTVGKHFAQPIRPRDAEGNPKKNTSRSGQSGPKSKCCREFYWEPWQNLKDTSNRQ